MTHDLLTKLPGTALFSRQQQVTYMEDAERTWSTLNQALLGSWEHCTRVRSVCRVGRVLLAGTRLGRPPQRGPDSEGMRRGAGALSVASSLWIPGK